MTKRATKRPAREITVRSSRRNRSIRAEKRSERWMANQLLLSAKDKILAECAIAFESNSDDCNKFVKAVGAVFFEPDIFSGSNMNADAILAEVRGSGDWTKLNKVHSGAIRDAKAGLFVIAGMTSEELGSSHGHLAIVVGDDGQNSGNILVPICYAGSLNPSARVQRKRISETFGSTVARESKISYFSRQPQTLPKSTAIDRLVDYVSGIRAQPDVSFIGKSKRKRDARKARVKNTKSQKTKGRGIR